MTSRICAICLDANDPAAVAAFWCEVLGWTVTGTEGNEFCLLLRTVQQTR